ncbi:MAG: ComEC/Rec2 family competence protein [Planctomycetes bacterium]|nr:ComEC/Rec2 family competence protein [Planctomycetota bacterium]
MRVVEAVDLTAGVTSTEEAPSRAPAPLLPVAVGMMAGVLLDDRAALSAWFYAVALVITTSLILAMKLRIHSHLVLLVLASASIGALRYHLAFRTIPADHIAHRTADEPVLCHLRGRVLTIPDIREPDPSVPRAYEVGPKTRFLLEASLVDSGHSMVPASGRIAVSIKEPVLRVRAGDIVEMTGWLYRPRPPANPGEYDRALASRRAGILAGMSCDHAEGVRVIGHTGRGLLDTLRLRLSALLLHECLPEDDPGAGVIAAVVLGHRDSVPKAMNDAFVRTGNAHFLAASGMNVAWVALTGWVVLALLGVYYRTRAIVMALLIAVYVLTAEPEPSIQRAGVMGLLGCLCLFLRGRRSVLNWLACSAVVVLMVDPADLFRPGFQLSFLGALAASHVATTIRTYATPRIIHAADRIGLRPYLVAYGFMPHEADPHIDLDTSLRGSLAVWFVKALGLTATVSLACWIATAPLCCYAFGQITPWGVLGTMILWLPALLATIVGFVKLALGIAFPSSAIFLGPLLAWATNCMTAVVDFLSHLPGTMIDGRKPSLAWVLATYAVIAWGVYWPGVRRFPHRFKIATLIILLWWAIPPRWVTHDADALNVWMLAVGDGTGTVVEFPNGKVAVVDFGTRSPFAAGNVATAFLRERGIRRVDTVFISHTDFDHFSGIEAIAREFELGRLIVNDHFEPYIRENSASWRFLKTIHEAGVPVEIVNGPKTFDEFGDVHLEAIWPPPLSEEQFAADNERSMVLSLTYQGRRLLLTGDIAKQGMAGLLQKGNVTADVLALPHHGSVVTNTKPFIDAVNPTICVRSSGQRRSMTRNGIEAIVGNRKYFNTSDDGCVLVRIEKGNATAQAIMRAK